MGLLGEPCVYISKAASLVFPFKPCATGLYWTLEEIAYYFGHVTVKGTPAIQTTVRSPYVSWTQVKETLKLLKGEEGWACTCVSARTVRMCFSSHTLPPFVLLLPKRYTSSRVRFG